MKDLITRIEKHLTEYKSKVLKNDQNGEYNYKGKIVTHSYILPKEYEEKNFISSEKNNLHERLIEATKGVSRHSYFNNLKSSQALCFNLLAPFTIQASLPSLSNLLGIQLSKDAVAEFEHKDDNKEKSEFDFYIEDGIHKCYFELKYTEQTLNTTSQSSNNSTRWNDFYSTPIEKITKDKDCITSDYFFKHYQLWRNISKISQEDSNVYFIILESREDLKKQILTAKAFLNKEYAERVHIITIEKICEVGIRICPDHFEEFKKKYLDY